MNGINIYFIKNIFEINGSHSQINFDPHFKFI